MNPIAVVLGSLSSWVIKFVDAVGVIGVGLLIAAENLFPPIPSELILPLAGYRAHEGQMPIVSAWVAATLGSLAGAVILYGMGALVGYERLHDLAGRRWFMILSQADLERGSRFFERHGGSVVLLGRCVPLVRSIVSVPAGLARMPLPRFIAYTVIGSSIWNAAFIGAGWLLDDQYTHVQDWVRPVGFAVLAALLVAIGIAITRRQRHRV